MSRATLLVRATLALLLVVPVGIFLLHAFSTRWFYPALLPGEWTPQAVVRLLSDSRTRSGLLESLWLGIASAGLSLLVGFPAARALALGQVRGAAAVRLLFFLPTVVPPLAVGMGLNILFLRLGLAGTRPGVLLVHLIPTLPYTIFALLGVFARYDVNYERQALVLGAGPWRIFWQVTLPMLLPGVVVAGLFAFLISWSQYLLTLLIGGGRVLTLPMLLFAAASGGNQAVIAALALLFALPPAIAIVAAARFLSDQTAAQQV